MIYFDNNATTPIDEQALAEMRAAYNIGPLNASSQHAAGRQARRMLDDAISRIGQALGADVDSPGGDQLIITSGGTEANHLALFGLSQFDATWIVSTIEHPSVLNPAMHASQQGRSVKWLPVDASGRIDLAQAYELLDHQASTTMVSVMAANNETGVLQPWVEIAEACRQRGLLCHVDATQWIGKLPFHFDQTAVSAVTIAAHKFHGPAGVGALLIRRGLKLRPVMLGGEQQLGLRPGTEPVPLVVGMATALKIANERLADATPQSDVTRIKALRDRFETCIKRQLDDVVFLGDQAARLPGTSCFALPGADRQAMLLALDLAGLACSSGSACASGSSRPSHVLQAMDLPKRLVDSALRIGLSRFSTAAEVDRAAELIVKHCLRLRSQSTVEKT